MRLNSIWRPPMRKLTLCLILVITSFEISASEYQFYRIFFSENDWNKSEEFIPARLSDFPNDIFEDSAFKESAKFGCLDKGCKENFISNIKEYYLKILKTNKRKRIVNSQSRYREISQATFLVDCQLILKRL